MDFSWEKWENAVKGKRIIGYGTGANAHQMLYNKRFEPFISQLDYFVDIDIRKHGKKLIHKNYECLIEPLERIDSEQEIVVIVTISDYLKTGKMLDEKKITWFPWVVISTDIVLDDLFHEKKQGSTSFFLMNTPAYVNLGDHAIAVAEDDYLRRNFGDYYEFNSHQCNFHVIEKLTGHISKEDVIFFQGGGNLGSLWRINEEIFRKILLKFQNNPVIVFPQSIYYGDTEEEKEYFRKSQEIYNSHKNLLICVRDSRSYDFVRSSYECRCMLLPDIVLTLKYHGNNDRKGIGVLLRRDKEQITPDEYEKTINNVISHLRENRIIMDHQPNKIIENRKNEIEMLMEQYSKCKLVITDRLHGMILSAVTGTPCIVFDNSYHKISNLYETWLNGCSCITVSDIVDEDELLILLEKKLSSEYIPFDNSEFTEKYNLLTDYVRKLL